MRDHDPATAGTLTRLVIPVPELAHLVPGAHVTLLDPFLEAAAVDEGVVAELGEVFDDFVPFTVVLGEATRFPGGAAYLPPQPAGTFRRITASLRRAFPEVIGHVTALHSAIPHLPLPEEAVAVVPTPLEVHAREAVLLHGDRVLATFRFGESAA